MIRNTLPRTKKATFVVTIPDENRDEFPTPQGTGFFVSPDGYFITANHVIESMNIGDTTILQRPDGAGMAFVHASLEKVWKEYDIALMKADFSNCRDQELLKGLSEFPYIDIELSELEEGTPIYAFGYPLPKSEVFEPNKAFMVGLVQLSPRTTSAIIASSIEYHGLSSTPGQWYVIDKALNYGNSGGPIVDVNTGRALAVCCKFQPVYIPQNDGTMNMMPSLYGVASSLANIKYELEQIVVAT